MKPAALLDSLDRRNFAVCHGSHARDAGMARIAVDQDGARSALAFAAPVLASRQIELVAKDEKQAGLRIGINLIYRSIDMKLHYIGHRIASDSRPSTDRLI